MASSNDDGGGRGRGRGRRRPPNPRSLPARNALGQCTRELAGISAAALRHSIPTFPNANRADVFCSTCHFPIDEDAPKLKCYHCPRSSHTDAECIQALFPYYRVHPPRLPVLELLLAPKVLSAGLLSFDRSGGYLVNACVHCIDIQNEALEWAHLHKNALDGGFVPQMVHMLLENLKGRYGDHPSLYNEGQIDAELGEHFLWKKLSLQSIYNFNKLVGFNSLGHFYNLFCLWKHKHFVHKIVKPEAEQWRQDRAEKMATTLVEMDAFVRSEVELIKLCTNCFANRCLRNEPNWDCLPCPGKLHQVVWALPREGSVRLPGFQRQYMPAKVYRHSSSAQTQLLFFDEYCADGGWLYGHQLQNYDHVGNGPLYRFSLLAPSLDPGKESDPLSEIQEKMSKFAVHYLMTVFEGFSFKTRIAYKPIQFAFIEDEYKVFAFLPELGRPPTLTSNILEVIMCRMARMTNDRVNLNPEMIGYFMHILIKLINEHPQDHTIVKSFFYFEPDTGLFDGNLMYNFSELSLNQLAVFAERFLRPGNSFQLPETYKLMEVYDRLKAILWN